GVGSRLPVERVAKRRMRRLIGVDDGQTVLCSNFVGSAPRQGVRGVSVRLRVRRLRIGALRACRSTLRGGTARLARGGSGCLLAGALLGGTTFGLLPGPALCGDPLLLGLPLLVGVSDRLCEGVDLRADVIQLAHVSGGG